jgi:carbamoyltransferase
MNILGISCYYHDAAAALLRDGALVAAAQEERFSRVKHDSTFPSLAIRYCLDEAGIEPEELDYVVFYEKPFVKFERILLSSLASFPRSWRLFGESMINWFEKKLWIKSTILRELQVPCDKVLFVDHHDAHAASALYCSPYQRAAILTIDGVGEWTTTAMGSGRADWQTGADNSISLTMEQRFPHSIGLLYSAFTAFLGFRVNNGEYKVMGMAPYGSPRFADEIHDKILTRGDDGSFGLNMDYLSYHYSPDKSFGHRFVELFGQPRKPDSPFVTTKTNPGECDPGSPEVRRNQRYADVAASVQKVTEEILLDMVQQLHRSTGESNLCMAGGVALNSVANGRIKRESPFDDVYIQPAAGDAGGALGAALYAWHVLLKNPRSFVMEHGFWGKSYGADQTRQALDDAGLSYVTPSDRPGLVDMIVDALCREKVVGLYQDRFEWGPRALGNRSILADPRPKGMKDKINSMIKFREPFRPFAPVVPESSAPRLFQGIDDAETYFPARFMLAVMPWRPEVGDKVPAVNHMGTGRLQTVRREWNPTYYDVVEGFGQATGTDVLLNTSFNLRGEPIVSSPSDAVATFCKSGIDHMALDGLWVTKSSQR